MARLWHPGPRSSALVVPVVALLLLLIVAVSACSLSPAPTPTATPAPKAAATATPVPLLLPLPRPKSHPRSKWQPRVQAWESGPHNNKYDLYKGPNTYCARCHSPLNWDPKATVGKPPNCFSCKFPTDKEVRISPLAPLIAEADWKKVDCAVCHRGDKAGVVDPAIAIWNNGTEGV